MKERLIPLKEIQQLKQKLSPWHQPDVHTIGDILFTAEYHIKQVEQLSAKKDRLANMLATALATMIDSMPEGPEKNEIFQALDLYAEEHKESEVST